MATFWVRAAHSVDHMISFIILVISRFVFRADFGFSLSQFLGIAYLLLLKLHERRPTLHALFLCLFNIKYVTSFMSNL